MPPPAARRAAAPLSLPALRRGRCRCRMGCGCCSWPPRRGRRAGDAVVGGAVVVQPAGPRRASRARSTRTDLAGRAVPGGPADPARRRGGADRRRCGAAVAGPAAATCPASCDGGPAGRPVLGLIQFGRWAYARAGITRQLNTVTYLLSPILGWTDFRGGRVRAGRCRYPAVSAPTPPRSPCSTRNPNAVSTRSISTRSPPPWAKSPGGPTRCRTIGCGAR